MKHPRSYPQDAYTELQSRLSRGHYQRFDQLGDVPSALSRVAAFPAEGEFRTAVAMASLSSEHPPTIGGITPASSSPVFRVSAVRVDRHGSTGELHLNKDDTLIYGDTAGRAWQLHAHDQPGHYKRLSTDSGLDVALNTYKWPRDDAGTVESLRAAGALVDFSTGRSSNSAT